MDTDHYKAIQDEVDRLLRIGFIIESYYPNRLANPMLVLKPNGKWRTYINFTNLNKACLKIVSPIADKLAGRYDSRTQAIKLRGCVLEVEPDPNV